MAITVTIEGQPWDDPAAPWTPTTHTFTHPIEACQMISAADHYLNTRPLEWAADTSEERDEIRAMLGRRPYLAYVLDLERSPDPSEVYTDEQLDQIDAWERDREAHQLPERDDEIAFAGDDGQEP